MSDDLATVVIVVVVGVLVAVVFFSGWAMGYEDGKAVPNTSEKIESLQAEIAVLELEEENGR